MTLSAALLDRDGTINVKAGEGDYIKSADELRLLPGAAAAIRALNALQIPVVIITNQRGIARGLMTEADLAAVHAGLRRQLAAKGAHVDAIFHCPHNVGECRCRKPGTLLFDRAREWLGLSDLANAVMIGDSVSDVSAGQAAGTRVVFIGPRQDAPSGVQCENSLLDAVLCLLEAERTAQRPSKRSDN